MVVGGNGVLERAKTVKWVTKDVQRIKSIKSNLAIILDVVCIDCSYNQNVLVTTFSARFGSCDDFGSCSATCGSGVKKCQKKCIGGNIGDEGCAVDHQFRVESCNNNQCPFYRECNDFSGCSVACKGGTKTCTRQCQNGNIGDIGCASDLQIRTEECNPQECGKYLTCSYIVKM